MKKLIIIFFALTSFCKINAQVTLEHTYNNVVNINGSTVLQYVSLSATVGKYLYVDYPNSVFTLYNLDHTVFKTCSFPYTFQKNNFTISHISTTLFDCDSTNVEYAMYYFDRSSGANTGFFAIYRTDGTQLFRASNVAWLYGSGSFVDPAVKSYIFQTTNGSKLVLNFNDSTTKVYSLCGKVFSGLDIGKNPEINIGLNNAYPNPYTTSTIVEYKLPEGEKNGVISFYDNSGKEIKEFKVDNSFSNIILDTNDIPAGEYYYILRTSSGISEGKKLIHLK